MDKKNNKNSDSGALLGLIAFTVCLGAFMYMVDLDKFSRSVEKFIESDDPMNLVILVIGGFIIGGLLMAIESRPKK